MLASFSVVFLSSTLAGVTDWPVSAGQAIPRNTILCFAKGPRLSAWTTTASSAPTSKMTSRDSAAPFPRGRPERPCCFQPRRTNTLQRSPEPSPPGSRKPRRRCRGSLPFLVAPPTMTTRRRTILDRAEMRQYGVTKLVKTPQLVELLILTICFHRLRSLT